jgi:translation initiation factor IF-2
VVKLCARLTPRLNPFLLFACLPQRPATIIGFSVKAPRSIETLASSKNIPLYTESVIYRLIELVRTKVAGLLPPIIETRVNGEATVLQVFTIAVKGQKEGQVVAGCRVGNGVVGKGDVVRVLRGEAREVVFEGQSPRSFLAWNLTINILIYRYTILY